jgi:tRNA A-37 threonylcarbamoyl transferase component Bud32
MPKLVIPYRADNVRTVLTIMGALSPIWLFQVPYIAFIALQAAIRGGFTGYMDLFWLFCFFAGLFMLSVLNVWLCLDSRLIVDAGGIRFPPRFLLSFLGKKRPIELLQRATSLRWADLGALSLERWDRPSAHPDTLCFQFATAALKLGVSGFSKDDLRSLLLSMEAHRPDLPIEPPLSQVDLGLPVGNGCTSFTALWQEELTRSFGSTAYVPLEAGRALQDGRITIVGQAAFGGLSAVYLAKLAGTGTVMVKEAVVPANANEALKAKALEMFNREAKILCSLKHPRIARVLDHFVENGRNYLVLEHIKGKDLRRFVKEHGSQPDKVVIRWSLEAAHLLDYLHGLTPPVVHRDLTPDNLLLENDGSITLIDFGAANCFLGTATGTLVGKQSYMPPEQLRGKAVPQSDLYALGCTMHFLLTGDDPEPLAVSSPRSAVPAVSSELDKLVQRLTALELDERIGSAQELAAALSDIAGHQSRLSLTEVE